MRHESLNFIHLGTHSFTVVQASRAKWQVGGTTSCPSLRSSCDSTNWPDLKDQPSSPGLNSIPNTDGGVPGSTEPWGSINLNTLSTKMVLTFTCVDNLICRESCASPHQNLQLFLKWALQDRQVTSEGLSDLKLATGSVWGTWSTVQAYGQPPHCKAWKIQDLWNRQQAWQLGPELQFIETASTQGKIHTR